jgi:hypothetical protein
VAENARPIFSNRDFSGAVLEVSSLIIYSLVTS